MKWEIRSETGFWRLGVIKGLRGGNFIVELSSQFFQVGQTIRFYLSRFCIRDFFLGFTASKLIFLAENKDDITSHKYLYLGFKVFFCGTAVTYPIMLSNTKKHKTEKRTKVFRVHLHGGSYYFKHKFPVINTFNRN